MTEQVVTLRITADGKVAVKAVDQVGDASERMGARTQQGAQRAARGLDDASAAAGRLGGESVSASASVVKLVTAAGGMAAIARGAISAADAYANINSRLRLATRSHAEFLVAQAEVFAISQRTSTQLEATATLYSKLATAMNGAGASQRQLLALTETINQAFAINGASADAQTNAIMQLTQAFAGGVLRAEEFNSVMENGPRLGQALAAGLGVGMGELRRQVNEGEVTVARVVAALQSQAGVIKTEFEGIPLTVGRAWTQLQNTVLKTVGEISTGTGAITALSTTVVALGKNLDVLATALGTVGAVVLLSVARNALQDIAQRKVAASALAEAEAQFLKARAMAAAGGSTAALTAAELRLAAAQEAATVAGVGRATMLGRLGASLAALSGGPIGAAVLALGGLYAITQAVANAEEERAAKFQAGVTATRNAAATIDGLNAQLERARQHYDQLPDFAATANAWSDATQLLTTRTAELNAKRAEMEVLESRVLHAQQSSADGAGVALLSLVPKLEQVRAEYTALEGVVTSLSTSLGRLNFDQFFNPSADAVAGDQAGQALKQLTTAAKAAEAQIAKNKQGQIEYWQALAATRIEQAQASGATQAQVAAMQAENAALLATIGSTMKKAEVTRAARDAGADYVERLREQVATYGQTDAAAARYELSTKKLTAAQRTEAAALIETLDGWDRYGKTVDAAIDAKAELVDGNRDLDEQLARARDELAGLDAAQIAYNESVREANRLAEESLALGPPTLAHQQAIEDRLRKLSELRDADRAIQSHQEITREAMEAEREQLRRSTQMWGDFADAVFDATQQSGGFLRNLLRNLRDIVTQMLREWFRTRVIGMFAGNGGGGGWGSLLTSVAGAMMSGGAKGSTGSAVSTGMDIATGGSGGGFDFSSPTSWISAGRSLWNGFSGGFAPGATATSSIFGSYTGAFGGLAYGPGAGGSALGLVPNYGAGAPGVGVGVSPGSYSYTPSPLGYGLAIAGGVVAGADRYRNSGRDAAGIAGGAAYGVGTAYAAIGTSAALSGGIAAGVAAIPVVGWIAIAAMLIDMFAGGKLFGTAFRPEKTTQSMTLGADGASAGLHLSEVRQRGWFAGRTWRGTDLDVPPELQEAAERFYKQIEKIMTDGARQLAIDVPPMIDATLRTVEEYDKKGKVTATKYFVDMLGRTWEESSAELAATRVSAEAIVATVAASEAGKAASTIAERWRKSAEELLDGAQLLLAASVDISKGKSLLSHGTGIDPKDGDALTQVVDLVESLANSGESLVQTYARLKADVDNLQTALDLMGQTLDLSGAEFVEFAAAIEAAAGGIDKANALWQKYFQSYFSPVELGQRQVAVTRENANESLAAIGLDPSTTMAELRERFDAEFPKLTPEQIVKWLEAAAALADATAAQEQYTAALNKAKVDYAQFIAALGPGSSVSPLEAIRLENEQWERGMIDQANALARARGLEGAAATDLALIHEQAAERLRTTLLSAAANYAGFIAQLAAENGVVGSISPFEATRLQVQAWERQTIAQAHSLARAAGLQSASVRDVTMIHQIAAQRIAQAARQIKSEADQLAVQLGYRAGIPGATAANDAVANWGSSAVDQTSRVIEATRALYQAQMAGLKSISDYLVSMQFGDLSGLNPEQQLDEARRQLLATQQAALGGDAQAMQALPQMAQTFLSLLRGSQTSGGDFNAGYAWVRQLLQSVVAAGPTVADPGDAPDRITPSYLDQRDARIVEQDALSRQLMAARLTQHLGDLAEALNIPVLELMQQMGVPLQRLAADLGINLNNITAASVTTLAQMAADLGIPLTELVTGLGLNMSNLTAGLQDMAAKLGINLTNITGASVTALAEMARELGLPLGELVQGLGLQLPDLAAGVRELADGLGIDLTTLTNVTSGQLSSAALATVQQLAGLSGSLGTNLRTLAQSLGVDLGRLTDVNSPIFVALGNTIDTLSPDIKTELQPLLNAVRDASGDEAKNLAVRALRDHVDELAPDIRDLLGPYFDDIVPSGAMDQLDYLEDMADDTESMERTMRAARDLLDDIFKALKASNRANSVPGYEVGTGYVPNTGLALIHQGEAIIPAPFAAWLRTNGLPIATRGRAANDDREITALRAELRELREAVVTADRNNVAVTGGVRSAVTAEGLANRRNRDENARKRGTTTNRSTTYG